MRRSQAPVALAAREPSKLMSKPKTSQNALLSALEQRQRQGGKGDAAAERGLARGSSVEALAEGEAAEAR